MQHTVLIAHFFRPLPLVALAAGAGLFDAILAAREVVTEVALEPPFTLASALCCSDC